MKEYSVFFENSVVGKAQFLKEGMYQRIKCTCKIKNDNSYDAFVKTTGGLIPLGILVPVADGIGTQRRILSKSITGENISVVLFVREKRGDGVVVEPEKPFPDISKIKKLKVITDTVSGQIRLVIT